MKKVEIPVKVDAHGTLNYFKGVQVAFKKFVDWYRWTL